LGQFLFPLHVWSTAIHQVWHGRWSGSCRKLKFEDPWRREGESWFRWLQPTAAAAAKAKVGEEDEHDSQGPVCNFLFLWGLVCKTLGMYCAPVLI
jgi:hypothetical protein